MYRLILFLVCTLVGNCAYSIDKEIHPLVTYEAIKQFNTCASMQGERGGPISELHAEIISDYTRKEDDVTVDRVNNWHFYDHYRGDEYAMPAHKSLHRIYKKRIDSFESAYWSSNEMEYYEAAGRIIHYIQDMAIPAHVAPNYHAKPEKLWQRIFVSHKPDPVDSLMNPNNFSYEVSPTHCKKLYASNDMKRKEYLGSPNIYFLLFQDLLVTFAENTRKAIRDTKFPRQSKTFEEEFWLLRSPDLENEYPSSVKKSFAPYGNYNNRERFNLHSGVCKEHENGSLCKAFVQARYKETIDFTVRALMYISDSVYTPEDIKN